MFDYVIVGGGSAGCVLASRLSEDPDVSVCLLEAGPRDTHPMIHMPLGILWMMRSKVLNWHYRTRNEPALAGRALYWPSGRTLGGSSSSNAMIYMRGHPSDYDAWAALGNPGWSFKEVLPYFKRAQHQERGASELHGVGGPLNVADVRTPNVLSRTFIQAGIQAGIPYNEDFNGKEQEGIGLYQLTQIRGRRCSAARAYLRPARSRPNLSVITEAHACRVLFRGATAIGVEYRRHEQLKQVHARREVILSAGAIQSPKLLMLSGIGDAADLASAGITVRKHLPGVGKNLQDHLDVIVVHTCTKAVSWGITLRNSLRGAWDALRYLVAGRGMYTTNGAEGCAFARSSPQEAIPDLQFHFTPARLSQHGRDFRFLLGEGYSLHVCNLRPKSRGEIRLAGSDPLAKPDIVANYLSDPEDMEHMVKGVKLARKILTAPAFDRFRGVELIPDAPLASDDDIRDFIRRRAETIYHPVGTCKMGNDPMSVVDAELRVHGMQGLRVVDASIMPLLIGGNTNAPTMMIAEKASDMIRQARKTVVRESLAQLQTQETEAVISRMRTSH
ncbi:choline dehydrogenase [Noviherbaspirillum sp.]|uniref:GMC family oxidoreductase n=1 Tax=Noviherbaspirillum sp. TaxID=1926288 RepID=UPI002B4660BB|nr:choline dehydrogenase [Noviherbaspirillum sp.]HJV80397.1 choline dehydrogenase [Noviherbaspirillum sp.]